jgi:hypothetical protein
VTSTNPFALKNSNLNAFLFADVGTELNGSALTILSVLARLGQDPWAEAAQWAKMPKAAAIDCLAQCIGKMPLGPQALAETYATASSLVQLLPVRTQDIREGISETRGLPTAREWAPMALLCLSLILSVLVNMSSNHPSPAAATTPTTLTADIRSNPDRTMAAKPLVTSAVPPAH